MERTHRSVGPRRTSHQDSAGDVRITRTHFPDHLKRQITRFVRREQNFITGIVLPEEAFDVLLKLSFQSMHWLKHGHGREVLMVGKGTQLLSRVRPEPPYSPPRPPSNTLQT